MAISVKFMKMHALGNDFVIIDAVTQSIRLSEKQVSKIASRHFGIGCDQVLVLEAPNSIEVDFFCRIYNANGSEVSQCGNGLRCLGRFIKETGLSIRNTLSIATLHNTVIIEILEYPLVRVNLGAPKIETTRPITIEFLDQSRSAYIIDLGNPHCVFFLSQITPINSTMLRQWGEALQTHTLFPKGVNMSLVECLAKNHIKMMTYERGAGETLSCGSAASAAVVAGNLSHQLSHDVRVDLQAGALNVYWQGNNNDVFLTGPTTCVFLGQFVLNNFAFHF